MWWRLNQIGWKVNSDSLLICVLSLTGWSLYVLPLDCECVNFSVSFMELTVTLHFIQVFLLYPPPNVTSGDEILIHFLMSRSKINHRLMEVDLSCEIKQSIGKSIPPLQRKFFIEWATLDPQTLIWFHSDVHSFKFSRGPSPPSSSLLHVTNICRSVY